MMCRMFSLKPILFENVYNKLRFPINSYEYTILVVRNKTFLKIRKLFVKCSAFKNINNYLKYIRYIIYVHMHYMYPFWTILFFQIIELSEELELPSWFPKLEIAVLTMITLIALMTTGCIGLKCCKIFGCVSTDDDDDEKKKKSKMRPWPKPSARIDESFDFWKHVIFLYDINMFE